MRKKLTTLLDGFSFSGNMELASNDPTCVRFGYQKGGWQFLSSICGGFTGNSGKNSDMSVVDTREFHVT